MNQMSLWKESAMSTRFIPPTIEEIMEYLDEKGYDIDAEEFWLFYDQKNWMVGKNKMSKWRSAVALWAKRNAKKSAPRIEPWKAAYYRVKAIAKSLPFGTDRATEERRNQMMNQLSAKERHCLKLCGGATRLIDGGDSKMWDFKDFWNMGDGE